METRFTDELPEEEKNWLQPKEWLADLQRAFLNMGEQETGRGCFQNEGNPIPHEPSFVAY